MRQVDRWLSVGLATFGVLMILVGQIARIDDQVQRSLIWIGVDCTLFSTIGFFHPRSNEELKTGATNFVQFLILAIATFGAVAILVFIAFGAPKALGDDVLTTALILGLAAALIVPILSKQLVLKMQTKK